MPIHFNNLSSRLVHRIHYPSLILHTTVRIKHTPNCISLTNSPPLQPPPTPLHHPPRLPHRPLIHPLHLPLRPPQLVRPHQPPQLHRTMPFPLRSSRFPQREQRFLPLFVGHLFSQEPRFGGHGRDGDG